MPFQAPRSRSLAFKVGAFIKVIGFDCNADIGMRKSICFCSTSIRCSSNFDLSEARIQVPEEVNVLALFTLIETWRCDYNRNRPHSSRGNLNPEEHANQDRGIRTYGWSEKWGKVNIAAFTSAKT